MQPIYADITARILAELEKGAIPWIKPWKTDASADRNIASGKPYLGVNRLMLGLSSMTAGYNSPVWGTFRQWQTLGANVRKGERATHIVFFKPMTREVITAGGDKGLSAFRLLRGYCVFNSDQVDGIKIERPAAAPVPEFQRHERAESTLVKSGAIILHGGDAAYYAPGPDSITLPNKSAFAAEPNYYATAFHELTHWTGHKSRLDRIQTGRYGNPEYAFEELVAEIGAAFLCADHGIAGELRHAGYIQSWIKALRENDRAIIRAAALSQKAADYILSLDATAQKVAA